MRFDLLFEDLEGQLEAQLAAEGAQQRAEAERLRAARTGLRDRLAALVSSVEGSGAGVRLRFGDGVALELAPLAVGRDWLSAELAGGDECIVPLGAVTGVSLDAPRLRASRERMPEPEPERPRAPLTAKLGIGVVLRDLARRRVALDAVLAHDDGTLHGTIDRVGLDHFDLAVHERGAARRASAVLETRIVPLAALVMLRV